MYNNPKPVLLTLTKSGTLGNDVTGLSWRQLVASVEALPNVDRSWRELAGFLVAEEVVVPPLPAQLVDYRAMLPVFRGVNRTIKRLWPAEPRSLYWRSGLDDAVRRTFEERHHLLLTGGPVTYGLRPVGDNWEWRIAVGTGSDYTRVRVDADAVIQAAWVGRLSGRWTRSHDRDAVLKQERPFVSDASTTDIIDWLSGALEELHDAGVLEPYLQAVRTKLELEAQGRVGSVTAPASIEVSRP